MALPALCVRRMGGRLLLHATWCRGVCNSRVGLVWRLQTHVWVWCVFVERVTVSYTYPSAVAARLEADCAQVCTCQTALRCAFNSSSNPPHTHTHTHTLSLSLSMIHPNSAVPPLAPLLVVYRSAAHQLLLLVVYQSAAHQLFLLVVYRSAAHRSAAHQLLLLVM